MGERIVMSSNRRDSHGDLMTKEALEHAVVQINGKRKLGYIMNHRRDLPPLGKSIDAKIEQSGELALLTVENVLYPHRKQIEWDENLIMEYFDESEPFISRYDENVDNTFISLDPSNFSSREAFESLSQEIHQKDKDVDLEMHGRKAEIPIPEIIIGVAKVHVLYKLLKPFAKKIADKITDKIAEDAYDETKKQLKKFRDYIVGVIKSTRQKAIPKNKALTIIFEIHDTPFIELIAKTDNTAILSKGLSEKKLAVVQAELDKFCQLFSVDRIQFKLNDSGNWKFNYLMTTEGKAVGQKASFKERDRQYERYKVQGLSRNIPKLLKRE